MAWTAQQRDMILEAVLRVFEIQSMGKPVQFLNFLESTKAQQAAAIKARIQARRDRNQADSAAAPAEATAIQVRLGAENVVLDDLLSQL